MSLGSILVKLIESDVGKVFSTASSEDWTLVSRAICSFTGQYDIGIIMFQATPP